MNEQTSFLWEKLRHENELFSSRANFFLVAHTLLVASISMGKVGEGIISILVYILGVLISIIWLYIGVRSIKIQGEIKSKLTEPVSITERKPRFLGIHILIGILIPLMFVFFWSIVLILNVYRPN